MSIEAMKQIVKEAVYHRGGYWIVPEKEFESLRQAIAEAEKQEPVALMVVNGEISYKSTDDDQSFGMWCPVNYDSSHSFPDGTKFYTRPQPKREWVGLTDEQIHIRYKAMRGDKSPRYIEIYRDCENAHGIKGK